MSFLRRDKSKANLRLYALSAAEAPATTDPRPPRKLLTSSASPLATAKDQDLIFNQHFEDNKNTQEHSAPEPLSPEYRDPENYSPRLLIVLMAPSQVVEPHPLHLKDNYRGFHANKRTRGVNVPPLLQPIKPRFKKKSSLLLGKFIYLTRKDLELSQDLGMAPDTEEVPHSPHLGLILGHERLLVGLNNYTTTGTRKSVSSLGLLASSKHKFRLPLLLAHHSHNQPRPLVPRHASHDLPERHQVFDLDLDPSEMQDIVRAPEGPVTPQKEQQLPLLLTQHLPETQLRVPRAPLRRLFTSLGVSTLNTDHKEPVGGWKAPDLWDVKLDASGPASPSKVDAMSISSDDTDEKGPVADASRVTRAYISSNNSSMSLLTSTDEADSNPTRKHRRHHEEQQITDLPVNRAHLPVLYGLRQKIQPAGPGENVAKKGPNHIVRVFREDNTFTTILCPLETTTSELLAIAQRKFFLESIANYQISVYVGNCVKVLEPFEKPLKIQMGLLTLSGYSNSENLNIIGREDLSFVCKFVVENIFLRSLTLEEETILSKDYVDVNIAGLNLKNIPIIFHQHTYEIEKLNVGDNPSIYIPLDFIQSCNNLTSIIFSKNGCSKFPMNFLEAKKLTHLDLEKNFLDELPTKFSHLRNLTHLRLNSNQILTLPRSFGKLKNLIALNLLSNYFNSYPEAVSELTNLRDLDLSYNDLLHVPDSIGRLTKLSKLNLCTNKLTKSLPECFTSLTSLKRLDIRFNKISNVDVLGSLPNLEVAYASKNAILGFSDKMESLRLLHFDRSPITNLRFENVLPMLTVLDLSKAKITLVPASFVAKIPHVEKLVLDKNHLVTLPDELGNLKKLAFLSVYGNNLQSLPSTIGQLTLLQYLDLHSNNVEQLPDDIWNLKNLLVLNAASNLLTLFPKPPLAVAKRILLLVNFNTYMQPPPKPDPTELKRPSVHLSNEGDKNTAGNTPVELPLELLELLPSVSNEVFAGTNSNSTNTSSSLADSLLVLTLADNRLTDDGFELLSLLVMIKLLNLSYNDLIEIPEGSLRRMTRLTELYLSGNELTNLPADDMESNKQLRLLFLNNNKLVSLPAELSKLTHLQHLDVGSNQLKYNISNWPYDWNWHWNKSLRYLNFSGNKRFEIKQSHIKNPDTGEDFDSLLVLKQLRVLGLIDVTLTTTLVPDQSENMRIRTTASELDNVGYGVSDLMGMRDVVSSRDIFIQKFRGNEKEVLFCLFDGRHGAPGMGHRILALCKSMFVPTFTAELERLKEPETVNDAIRRTFLSLNKDINGVLLSQKAGAFTASTVRPELAELTLANDGQAGCAVTLVYICDRMLYTANVGDIEALLLKDNGDHIVLTTKHDPTNRPEFERIRALGGYVSGDGALDGEVPILRAVGFFNYLPHTHLGPDITQLELTAADDMIVMATKVFWDYVSYELAVDILRQEKDDPMIAAQKLRDYAICYGASDKVLVVVITLGEHKNKKQKFGNNSLYHNLGRELGDLFPKKRRERIVQGDLALRRLEDEIEPPVGELALVFTDIKNSTLLWDTYPVAMRSAIKLHNTIMRRQLRIVGGYEVKTEGDAFMVSFPLPTLALLWCFNVQNQLLVEDWPSEILETDQCCAVTDADDNVIFRGLLVRMGVHWGSPVCELDMVTRRMDYFGPMVNRASRILAIADGGQIAASSDFLDEIKGLYAISDDIRAGRQTLSDAYHGNIRAGEIIEKEIHLLEENGCAYFEIGEKKLKGLETPEFVTLAYPQRLAIRFELFKKRLSREIEGASTRVVGTLPVDAIYGLRTVLLRLENICLAIGTGGHVTENFQQNSLGIISQKVEQDFKENDIIAMLSHIVVRIESFTAALEIRQTLRQYGGKGLINYGDPTLLFGAVDEIRALLAEHRRVTAELDALKGQKQ